MVAGHDGDVTLAQAIPQRVAVRSVFGAQWRADLGQGAALRHLGVGQQQVLRAGFRPHALPQALGLLDPFQTQLSAEVHDVGGASGCGRHLHRAVDRLLFRPVRTRRGEVRRMRVALAKKLVFEVFDDVAALAVKLQDTPAAAHQVHRLADVVVVAHSPGALLVGHEHLVGLHAQIDSIRESGKDAGPVLQDEVEGKVGESGSLYSFAGAVDSLGQRLVALQLVGAKGHQRGQAGVGGGQRAQGIVVVPVQVNVAVDQAGKHELAGGIDIPVGRGQVVLRSDRDDLLARDGDGTLVHLRRGYDLPAHDDGIHMISCHNATSLAIGYVSLRGAATWQPGSCGRLYRSNEIAALRSQRQ